MGSQDYIKFYFIKYDYNPKDSHQDDVDPEEEELEEFLRVTPPTYFTLIILARTSAINFHILH